MDRRVVWQFEASSRDGELAFLRLLRFMRRSIDDALERAESPRRTAEKAARPKPSPTIRGDRR